MQYGLRVQMALAHTYHCGRQLSARSVAIARARAQTGAQIGALGGDALLRVTQLISGLNKPMGHSMERRGDSNHIK